jgi:transcriptional regulator with XRE-family HTH domain
MFMQLRIRDLREDRDLTQADMAAFLGCRQQTYSRYENEQAQPSLETLARLAAYFGTSVDYLLGITDEPRPYPPAKRRR